MSKTSHSREEKLLPPLTPLIRSVNLCRGRQLHHLCRSIQVTRCTRICAEMNRGGTEGTFGHGRWASLVGAPVFVCFHIFLNIRDQSRSSRWGRVSRVPPKSPSAEVRLACGDIKERPFAFRRDSDVLPVIIKA